MVVGCRRRLVLLSGAGLSVSRAAAGRRRGPGTRNACRRPILLLLPAPGGLLPRHPLPTPVGGCPGRHVAAGLCIATRSGSAASAILATARALQPAKSNPLAPAGRAAPRIGTAAPLSRGRP